VLLSIGHARVEALVRDGHRAGRLLRGFKRNIDVPIAAILIVNTIAHTIGSAVAGATYADAFSADTLWIFTIVFTTAVLLFTEIVPKTLGVTYAARLASPVAFGIHFLTVVLRPLVLLAERISKALRGNASVPVTSVEELRLLAALGRNEGVVGVRTAGIIVGATRLGQLRAIDVTVPRHTVCFLSSERSLEENLAVALASGHSRFPLSSSHELDNVMGIVLIKELLFHLHEHGEAGFEWSALVR
jgi:CBS domain containing-hemolysin-like protein